MASEDLGREELRIALVMNGGVSLAVWIGGVVREVARLLSGRSAYGELADLLSIDPRVDVIAGTSAGGVNGAYLAMAMAFNKRGQELDGAVASLRTLWVDNGAIDGLLRSPLEKSPPSLLDGDGVYYEILLRALERLRRPKPTDSAKVPIDLILTATLLKGAANHYVDDYGAPVADVSHRALFRFQRDRSADPFAAEASAAQLALAARTTSSFPGAFEPSYCPLGPDRSSPERPDMTGIASFGESRFLIDGGILDNKPLDVALDSIFRQPASRPARRVLAYIVPAPEITACGGHEAVGDAPGMLDVVLSSLVEIPSVQSISAQLEALRLHNQAVRDARRSRIVITRYNKVDEIDALSETLFAAYRDIRAAEALDYVIARINEGLLTAQGTAPFGRRGRREWLYRTLYDLKDSLLWVPTVAPLRPNAAAERTARGWRWGTYPVEHLARLFLDLVIRTQNLAAASPKPTSLRKFWTAAFRIVARSQEKRGVDRDYWQKQAKGVTDALGTGLETSSPTNEAQKWFEDALIAWSKSGAGDTSKLASEIAAQVIKLAPIATRIAKAAAFSSDRSLAADAADLLALIGYFVRGGGDSPDLTLARLLAFEVVQQALGGPAIEQEEEVDFIQLSADDDPADGPVCCAADKLTGVQLAHFGAFYKRSWRANDWTWGRRDAIRRLVRLLLDPTRLKVVAQRGNLDAAAMAAKLLPIATAASAPRKAGWGGVLNVDSAAIEKELSYLDNHWIPVPERLPQITAAIARRIELEILREELPLLASSIETDREAALATPESVAGFARDCNAVVGTDGLVSAAAALALQERCNLGGQKLRDEAGTDPATKTLAQTLAVSVAALRSDKGMLAALGGIIGVLRAPTLLLYAFARNLAQRSRTGLFINASVTAASAVVVATAVLAGNPYGSSVLVSLAAAALAASIFLLVLRVEPWLRGYVAVHVVLFSFAAIYFGLLRVGPGTWRLIAVGEGVVLLLLILNSLLGTKRRRPVRPAPIPARPPPAPASKQGAKPA